MPAVPAWEEVLKPGSRAQHSSVEWLFCALRTVMFSMLLRARERVEYVRRGRRGERRILTGFGFGGIVINKERLWVIYC